MTYLHAVWYSFFQISLAVYFLWGQVGPSCLAGVVVIVFLIPVTKFIAAWLGRIQKLLMKARDERVALNNEILSSMKVIKIQAWEGECSLVYEGVYFPRFLIYYYSFAVITILFSPFVLLAHFNRLDFLS